MSQVFSGRRMALRLFLALVVLALGAAPAHARWLKAESPLFDVYSNGDEQSLRGFVADLEEYDKFLRLITQTEAAPSPNRFTIYLVANLFEIRTVAPGASDGILGFYNATPEGMLAVAERSPVYGEWISGRDVLFHEYTHHFMNQYYAGVYPRWYQEGFAEYCSTATFKGDIIEFGGAMPARVLPLTRESWAPIAQVFDPPSANADSRLGMMFYPESWLITHYLLRTPERQPQLNDYLLALRRGEAPEAAFQSAFKMSFAQFQSVLWNYFHGDTATLSRMRWKQQPAPPAIVVTTLPASADALLLLRARLIMNDTKAADGPKLAAEIRAAAKPFPSDPLAEMTLARAEIFYGNPDKADAPLDALLKSNPDSVEGLYLKGAQMMRRARSAATQRDDLLAKARPFFAMAHQRDPNHYPSLFQYALTFADAAGPPSDNTVNILLLAHELAPQVDEISLRTAESLLRVHRADEARLLLRAVAYQPHPGKLTEEAKRRLDELDKPPPADSPALTAPAKASDAH